MAVAEPIVANDQDTGQSELAQRLARTWRQPKGFWGWFCNTHHTDIGIRFMVTAFIFFLLGGVLAAMIRLQLIRPENSLMGPDLYNQVFTMHGSTMIFLFAVPMMFQGFGVYIVPLMCGARNIAFPRLNAFSYYLYVGGAFVLWGGLLTNTGADVGWFAYVPLSGPAYSPGHRADIWSQMITFTEVSALGVAICIATTILRHRAPGMTLNRMPILLWEKLVISIAVIFAMPAVMIASGLLLLDRLVGTHFFNPAEGGDVLLYQHLFWFFGHPEVYIIFLPGAAIVSTLVECFSRRRIFGYTPIVVSVVATGFIGFSVWVHHMFATGLPQLSESFFTAASLMIVIPTGTQFFCWVATIWNGRLQLRVAHALEFRIFLRVSDRRVVGSDAGFRAGRFTGTRHLFCRRALPLCAYRRRSFPMFAGIYYWFPKMTGRMANETLGKWHFWLFFFGFNMTFFTLHFLGLRGMPRRVYTYGPDMHWQGLNLIGIDRRDFHDRWTPGFPRECFPQQHAGEIAGNNPWEDAGLEWSMSSPPPPYNFLHVPTVSGRDPLWEDPPDQPIVVGLRDDIRETLVTHSLDADPQHKDEDPGPSIWPFLAALTVSAAFVGSIFTAWAVPIGAPPVIVTLIGWLWPRGQSPTPLADEVTMNSLIEPIRRPRDARRLRSAERGVWPSQHDLACQRLLHGHRRHDVCPDVRDLFLSANALHELAAWTFAARIHVWCGQRRGFCIEHHSGVVGEETCSGKGSPRGQKWAAGTVRLCTGGDSAPRLRVHRLKLSMDRRRLFIHGLGSYRDAFGTSGYGID